MTRRRIFLAAMLPVLVVLLFAVLLVSAAGRMERTARIFDRDRTIGGHLEHVIVHLSTANQVTYHSAFTGDTVRLHEIDGSGQELQEDFRALDRLIPAGSDGTALRQLEADIVARFRMLEQTAAAVRQRRLTVAQAIVQSLSPLDDSDLMERAHRLAHREQAQAELRRTRDRLVDRTVLIIMLAGALLSVCASLLTAIWLAGHGQWLASAADNFAKQKQATEKARQHAREVLWSMTRAVLVLDEEWNITSVTTAAAEIVKRSEQSLQGKNVWRELPQLGARFEQELLRSTAGQIPLYFEEYIPCWDAWLEFRTLPSETAIAVYINDTTEIHRQRELREQLLKRIENAATEWQQLFDAMDVPILVLDGTGRLMRMNEMARQLSGKEYDSLIGGDVRTVGDEELWQRAGALALEVSSELRARELRAEDSISGRTWEFRATPFSQPQSAEPRVIVQARDVTDLVALEYSLRMTDKLSTVGMVTAGVAHEVRNPLFSISSLVDAMDSSFPDSVELRPFMERLRGQVDRMRNLMTDLLEFGKASAPDTTFGALDPVIHGAIANSRPSGSTIKVTTSIAPGLPEIAMDAARLELVFRNLVENAAQHSPAEGCVDVEVSLVQAYGKEWIECTVADRGNGFAREDLPHIFEPFFTRRKGGTGLGLSIVQRIVLEHHGTVRARNRTGGGAAVIVRLPVLKQSVPAMDQDEIYASL